MSNPTTIPRHATSSRTWPVSRLVDALRPGSARMTQRGQFRDRLCAFTVIALVVGTIALSLALVIWELGPSRGAGSLNGQAVMPSVTAQADPGSRPEVTSGAATSQSIDVGSLTWVSVVIDLLIFVALGLFLRWDLRRSRHT